RDLLARAGEHGDAVLAVKVARRLPQARALGADFNARIIIYEAQVAQRLSHPNILRVFDFHRDGDTYYLTMEYLPGETLSAFLQRAPGRRLDQDGALRIAGAVAAALGAAHDQGIVHS